MTSPTVIDDEGIHPNSPSGPGLCVCEGTSQPTPTPDWVYYDSSFQSEVTPRRPAPFTRRRWSHDTRDLVHKPDQLLEDGLSSAFVCNTFKKRVYYPCCLRNLHHWCRYDSLEIRFLLISSFFRWFKNSSQPDIVHINQINFFLMHSGPGCESTMSVLLHLVIKALRTQHPETWHTETSSCWNPWPQETSKKSSSRTFLRVKVFVEGKGRSNS